MTKNALMIENIHPDASVRLTKEGYQVQTLPRALGEDELIDALRGVSLLGIRSGTHVTKRVLDAAPDLIAIGAFCIGAYSPRTSAALPRRPSRTSASSSRASLPATWLSVPHRSA
jgi:D-3-phosphoglycerate dehydrogenase